jgi:5-(carboxyamino)imidazole ribonucleotide mutase
MKEAGNILEELGVAAEYSIVSAHRTPDRMVSYALQARERGLKVIIAGAGGAAHLPGMTASMTTLPVIGVPIQSRNSMDGWDSVLSRWMALRMPAFWQPGSLGPMMRKWLKTLPSTRAAWPIR